MGMVGDAFDNAMAESFFASLECELIDRKIFKTRTEARLAVFTWIEGWYNPRDVIARWDTCPENPMILLTENHFFPSILFYEKRTLTFP